jgi:hypothetical protein
MELPDIFKPSPPSAEEFVAIIFFAFTFLVTADLVFGVLAGLESAFGLYFINKYFEPFKIRYAEKKKKNSRR